MSPWPSFASRHSIVNSLKLRLNIVRVHPGSLKASGVTRYSLNFYSIAGMNFQHRLRFCPIVTPTDGLRTDIERIGLCGTYRGQQHEKVSDAHF